MIKNNSDDQISVSGQATLGVGLNYIGGYNQISGAYGYSNKYLVDNNSSSSLHAMFNYWGGAVTCSMFDGGCSKLDYEEYYLSNNNVIQDENPGAGNLHPKTVHQESEPQTFADLFAHHKMLLESASSGSEIRRHLSQMFLVSRATRKHQPEIDTSFRGYLAHSADAHSSRFSNAQLNKTLRDAAGMFIVKSSISDGEYAEAAEYLAQLNPGILDGTDRMDYYHALIATETFAGNYRKAYVALQQYYQVAEQLNMDMTEIQSLNSVIEEDLTELLGQRGILTKDIILEAPAVDLSAYPNPFNPSTYISFSIPNQTHVTLKVFDLLGREVAELVNEQRNAGPYTVYFDASGLASGVYLYTLSYENEVLTNTMTIIK